MEYTSRGSRIVLAQKELEGEDLLLPSTRLDYCHNGKLYKKQPKNTGLGEERPLTSLDQLQKMRKSQKTLVLGEERTLTSLDQL